MLLSQYRSKTDNAGLYPFSPIHKNDVHRLDLNLPPNVLNHIGFRFQVFIKGGTIRELHHQSGAFHLALVIQQSTSADNLLAQGFYALQMRGWTSIRFFSKPLPS